MGLIDLLSFYAYHDHPCETLYAFLLDEFYSLDTYFEFTLLGIQTQDQREFEYLCDLSGCLDANL